MPLVAYFKLDEVSGGLVEDLGNVAEGSHVNGPTLGATGQYGNAVQYDGVDSYSESAPTDLLQGKTQLTICAWVNAGVSNLPSGEKGLFGWYLDANNYIRVYQSFLGAIWCQVVINGVSRLRTNSPATNLSTYRHILFTIDIGAGTGPFCFIDKSSVSGSFSGSYGASALPGTGNGVFFIGYDKSLDDEHTSATIDEVRIYDEILDAQGISDAFDGIGPGPSAQTIPVKLRNFSVTGAQVIPSRLLGPVLTSAQSVPTKLTSPDVAHALAPVAAWSAAVRLDGVDITAQLTDVIDIEHGELISGLADFRMLPSIGNIDLGNFERKSVQIDFEGRDAAGTLLYTSRRYTGITTRAEYDPRQGVITVNATTDLQGRVEQLTRAQIDSLVGGYWSEHVFDDTADGWQYARDRLSTIASEIHVDAYGSLRVRAFAAGTPSVTFTDSERFADTLTVERVSRRDLLSRVRVNFDFRYQRLRHREIDVAWYGPTFCEYVDGRCNLPTKAAITQTVEQNGWTLLDQITFDELPPTGTYCGGAVNWVLNDFGRALCLGASWTAARRWAQSVTEEYAIDVIAPDVEEAIGQQSIAEDYGVEAVFDSTDYEKLTDFAAAPDGSALNVETRDYESEATDAIRTGRAALDVATQTAIAKARSTLLERARRNRVTASVVYDPRVSIDITARINTPHLQATGKVARLIESLDIATGRPSMTVVLAVSRQGGSGLSVSDPIVQPDRPTRPTEEVTTRKLTLGWQAGGVLTVSPPDNDNFVGWVGNAYGSQRTDDGNLYRERFVLPMPEIEKATRDRVSEVATQSYETEIPDDELILVQ